MRKGEEMSNSVSACCHALIRVVSAPSESFLFCHKCGEACRVKGEAMSEELPGNLEIILRTEKQEWPHCMDAEVWVKKWKEYGMPEVDKDSLLCWFANAIMAGYDTACMQARKDDQ